MDPDVNRDSPKQQRAGPALHYGSEHPNFPEVSGTSLPLLTTVLAGFAVTIIVQIMVRPDIADDLPGRVVIALLTFLLSTILFLCSTVFAINAQANNYLPFIDLSDESTKLFNVDDVSDWLWRIGQRWYIYHLATIYSFYAGVILLLAGVNLIVWVYVGSSLALVVLAAILLSVIATIFVGILAGRLSQDRRQTHKPSSPTQSD